MIRDRGLPGPRVLTSLSPIQADTSVSSDSLRAMARRRKEQGADLIKIFASKSQRVGATPTITEDQLRVLCDEAKAVGLRSMVHAYRSQTGAAARAGCRELEARSVTSSVQFFSRAVSAIYLGRFDEAFELALESARARDGIGHMWVRFPDIEPILRHRRYPEILVAIGA